MMRSLVLCALELALAASSAQARCAAPDRPIPCARIEGGAGTVSQIASAFELVLATGEPIRLAEIGAPAAGELHPSAAHARASLARLALGKNVRLYFDGAQTDRHGRQTAQVLIEEADGPPDQVRGRLWLQRALVAEGAAYVDSWATNRECARMLLEAESEARAAGRGLWADAQNRILSADEAEAAVGRFAIIEGRVVAAAAFKNPARAFLNFGADYRTDFTVRIEPAAMRAFAKAKLDPLALEGALVRVRGYVSWRGGPEIEATHPEVIEVLEAGSGHRE